VLESTLSIASHQCSRCSSRAHTRQRRRHPQAAAPDSVRDREIFVRMGELAVSGAAKDVLTTIGLGSCVGLVLLDSSRSTAARPRVYPHSTRTRAQVASRPSTRTRWSRRSSARWAASAACAAHSSRTGRRRANVRVRARAGARHRFRECGCGRSRARTGRDPDPHLADGRLDRAQCAGPCRRRPDRYREAVRQPRLFDSRRLLEEVASG